ncbi:hypothetical protein LINPERPRIM_LOCUS23488 [Linum perenne]
MQIAAETNRISDLPDQIIHDILGRLGSLKAVAKSAVLSKRWNQLWLSYPISILDYHCDYFGDHEPGQRFVAGLRRKFSQPSPAGGIHTGLIKITTRLTTPTLIDDILELAANKSPREIRIKSKQVPHGLLQSPLPSVQILRLRDCRFNQYAKAAMMNNAFVGLGSFLRVLSLRDVKLPANISGRFLNGVIAVAALLEKLTLWSVHGPIQRIEIHNHQNLKTLKINVLDLKSLDIAGTRSLEIFFFKESHSQFGTNLQVSSTQNLKVLHIQCARNMTEDKLNKLISECPSLESLEVRSFPQLHRLRIVDCDKLREVTLHNRIRWDLRPLVIEIDTPRLSNLRYTGTTRHFPKILHKVHRCNGIDQSNDAVSFHCKLAHTVDVHRLKKFLVELSEFQVTLEFLDRKIHWERVEDGSPAPVIEHVKLSLSLILPSLDSLFCSCQPRYLSFRRNTNEECEKRWFLSIFKDACERFMEIRLRNHCEGTCTCWRHRLKDVRVMKRAANKSTKEVELIDLYNMLYSSFAVHEEEEVWFALTWL